MIQPAIHLEANVRYAKVFIGAGYILEPGLVHPAPVLVPSNAFLLSKFKSGVNLAILIIISTKKSGIIYL